MNALFRTNELIQRAIRNNFKQCAVLTIAHRLRTVIDSDRIMVSDTFIIWYICIFCYHCRYSITEA